MYFIIIFILHSTNLTFSIKHHSGHIFTIIQNLWNHFNFFCLFARIPELKMFPILNYIQTTNLVYSLL